MAERINASGLNPDGRKSREFESRTLGGWYLTGSETLSDKQVRGRFDSCTIYVKFTRGRYPDYPQIDDRYKCPCWSLTGKNLWIDIDWNTRFPFGISASVSLGEKDDGHFYPFGLTLEVNPPLGEPNRIYAHAFRWWLILGLPQFRSERPSGREINGVPVWESYISWRPHLAGCSRYGYHKDENDEWVRNAKPNPLNWGWLTIEKKKS